MEALDAQERKEILGQWGVREANARERAERLALERDLEGSPLRGRPPRRRLRNFRPALDSYVVALGGPLPYMQRLREIEDETAAHERRLEEAWLALAAECAGDEQAFFGRRWQRVAERWSFGAVNELIERHNRYYPAEARLPMDVRTGDFALVNGKPYQRPLLDATWVLERFPAALAEATDRSQKKVRTASMTV